MRSNFETAKAQLDSSTSRAAAWFDIISVQRQEHERHEQHSERAKADEARVAQKVESTRAEEERLFQAHERAEARADRVKRSQKLSVEDVERHNRLRHKVMKFLSRADSAATYRHALLQQSENPESCKWIFKATAYKQWQDQNDPSHALWMYSGPGTGKTVLAAQVVRRLREQYSNDGEAVLYFFCSSVNASKDDSLAILRTLLCQLLDYLPFIPEWILELYNDSYKRGLEQAQILTSENLQDMFCKTLDLFNDVQIVVDGIDEVIERKELLEILSSLGRRGVNDGVRILIVSRRESDISQYLRNFIHLPVHPANTRVDIETYIVQSIRTKLNVEEERANLIQNMLIKKARGMFIWCRLVIQMLEDIRTTEELQEVLSAVPQELHDVYCIILNKLWRRLSTGPSSRLEQARNIFKLLALSFRPLQISEIREALAVEASRIYRATQQQQSWSAKMNTFRPNDKSILDVCGNLIDETDGAISLLHHTLREFLLSGSGTRSPEVQKFTVYANTDNANITQSCLVYLHNVEGDVQQKMSQVQSNDSDARKNLQIEILSALPFYEYACRQWPFHFGRCPVEHGSSVIPHFIPFTFCTSWYQGWSIFSPSGRVPSSRLFRSIKKHGRLILVWLDILDRMLGGFKSQSAVSLHEIANYTSEAPMLIQERFSTGTIKDVTLQDPIDLEHVAGRGHDALVRLILLRTSPAYKEVFIALRKASEGHHEETVWILCNYLVTSKEHPSALFLAQSEEDEVVEGLLLEHIRTVQERIESFHRTGMVAGPLVPRVSNAKEDDQETSSHKSADPHSDTDDHPYPHIELQSRSIGSWDSVPYWERNQSWLDGGDHFFTTGDYFRRGGGGGGNGEDFFNEMRRRKQSREDELKRKKFLKNLEIEARKERATREYQIDDFPPEQSESAQCSSQGQLHARRYRTPLHSDESSFYRQYSAPLHSDESLLYQPHFPVPIQPLREVRAPNPQQGKLRRIRRRIVDREEKDKPREESASQNDTGETSRQQERR